MQQEVLYKMIYVNNHKKKYFLINLPFTREGGLWFKEVILSIFRPKFCCAWLSQRFESSIWKPLKFCIFWYKIQLEGSLTDVCIWGRKSEKTVKNHRKWVLTCFCWRFSFLILNHEAKWIAYSSSALKTAWIP